MSDGEAAQEVRWRRLHPASVAVNLIPRTWQLIRGFWPVLLVIVLGGSSDRRWLADLPILLWLLVAAVGNTVVHWATLTYRLQDGRLELRSGLLNRQRRVFSPKKVQHVEVVRNVFHRLTGLAEVRIETASGDEVEGQLSALSEQEAHRLVGALREGASNGAEEPDQPSQERVVVAATPWDLAWYGATSLRLGWIYLVILVGFEALRVSPQGEEGEVIEEGQALFESLSGEASSTWVLLAVGLSLVLLSWLAGIVVMMARHHGFTMTQNRDRVGVREGLTTTRRMELSVDRVQLVRHRASWLRRYLGFGSVTVETASAQAAVQGNTSSTIMAPVVYDETLSELLDVVLPSLPRPDMDQLLPPDPRALRRGRIRGVVVGSALCGGMVWWWSWWGLLGLWIPALLWWMATLDHRHQGWRVTDDLIVSRRGYLSRTTDWAVFRRIQSVAMEQGPLLRRYGLALVAVRLAGGSRVVLPLLAEEDAWDLATALAARVGSDARGRWRRQRGLGPWAEDESVSGGPAPAT